MSGSRRRRGPIAGQEAFVDTGAWIAMALSRDPLHDRAAAIWRSNEAAGTRWVTSVPVILETFTFLARAVNAELALSWKDEVRKMTRLRVLECTVHDLEAAWTYFTRRDLPKLSAVDATSFILMDKEKLKRAFSFDAHFATAGYEFLA